MTDLNHITVIGRLTHEITERDFGYITTGTARLNISIAVNRAEKHNGEWSDKASYFDVTVWGKTAENIKPYLNKGKQIAVDGHLDQQRWEKDGQKFSRVVIIADQVQLLGGKDAGAPAPQQSSPQQQTFNGDDFPEDIPF